MGMPREIEKMKYLIFTLLLGAFTMLRAQGTPIVELVSGVKYYVHFVQSGNTLYGIHKTYNVPVDKIITANPGCEKGLVEGQKLLIPISLVEVKHTVLTKETLFAISKKYGVKVEAIIADNPGADLGLKVGQVLLIKGVMKDLVLEDVNNFTEVPVADLDTIRFQDNPNLQLSFSDSIIDHIVLDHENLYSISKRYMVSTAELQRFNGLKNTKIKPGDRLVIPLKKEKIETVIIRQVLPKKDVLVEKPIEFPSKNTYNVALLLPLYLDRTEGYSEQLANFATEFYMGAKLALDSLESLGLHANVYIFDVKSDSASAKKIVEKDEFLDMDMVIGPFSMEGALIVSRWCKENEVRMVCPISLPTALIQNNRFITLSVPSEATQQSDLALFALKNSEAEQFILIKPTGEKDQIAYSSFRNAFTTAPFIGNRPKLIEASLENFTSFMKKGVKVILVFPTNEKLPALKFTNSLKSADQRFDSENIFIYGTKEWSNFDDVKPHFKNKYHFHFSSPNDLNYKYLQTEDLHRKYRSTYNSDMTKMAVQGFDVLYYFISDLLLNKKSENQIMNSFEMIDSGR